MSTEFHGPGTPGMRMTDVTSRVAYAYAKFQLFVWAGALLVVASLAVLVDELDNPAALGDDVVAVLGGLGILVMALRQKDLKRVNRHALGILAILLLVKAATVAASLLGLPPKESPADLGDDLGVLLVLGAVLLSYPLPTRRGKVVLYDPTRLRLLSNERTLGFALLFLALVSSAVLVHPELPGAGALLPPDLDDGLTIALGLAGFLLFLLLRSGRRTLQVLAATVATGLGVSLLGLLVELGSTDNLGDDVPKVLGLALALVVVLLLSPRLNQGRTIVDRRG